MSSDDFFREHDSYITDACGEFFDDNTYDNILIQIEYKDLILADMAEAVGKLRDVNNKLHKNSLSVFTTPCKDDNVLIRMLVYFRRVVDILMAHDETLIRGIYAKRLAILVSSIDCNLQSIEDNAFQYYKCTTDNKSKRKGQGVSNSDSKRVKGRSLSEIYKEI